ncbi:MAG: ABC transporter ATP-binding protein [Eubacteriales bacterium]|nr:ABC transporter ATP-binding protein [Eubacteriales bacterium]MDD4475345.1 ABC transporter ATP-binding protein [Eubacteriales bacterium]
MNKQESARPEVKPNRKYVFLRLWRYLYNYKYLLALAFVLSIVGNVLALVGPYLAGKAIDAIGEVPGLAKMDEVFGYAGLMMLLYVISTGILFLLSVVLIKLSRKVTFQMRKDLFNRLTTLPVSFFDKNQTGDIVSRMSYDIDTVNASLSNDLLQIARSVIIVIGSFAMMVAISPVMVLMFVVTIPVSVLFTKYMTKRVRPLYRKRSAKLGELNGYAEEIISGQKIIKAYRREEEFIERFGVRNKEAVDAYFKADFYGSAVGPGMNFINNISLTAVSVIGAFLFLNGGITPGNLSSFVLYSRKFSGPVNEMANIISELQSAMSAAERVFKLIDEKPEPEDDTDALVLSDVKGSIEFENVNFGYDPNVTIIKDMSLKVQEGGVVAIVGPTGAGKTTVINLLMRFYDPQQGRILIDGQDIKKVTRDSLRRSFTMVLQDTWLFGGTIFENVAYGSDCATKEDVERVCRAAKIHTFIESLPEGYDTVVNEGGMNISKGQKQLLTIARAMLVDSKMLILDEATSNVDTQTEQRIRDAMLELMKGKTSFVIAHRLSTIMNADIILVMKDGRIVETGNHRELLEKKGFYSELFMSQYE